MSVLKKIIKGYNSISLIVRIALGIVIGVILALVVPQATGIGLLGDLFVGALKAIAPVLVAVLVISSLCQSAAKLDRRFGMVIFLYMFTTFLAAMLAVAVSFIFPQNIELVADAAEQAAPSGIMDVLQSQLMNMITNPVRAVTESNYIGILFWAVLIGLALKKIASDSTRKVMMDLSDAISLCVSWVINMAPFGIMGLVFTTVSGKGLEVFSSYGRLLLVLVSCMLTMALVISPLIIGILLRTNPYPLIFRCIRESGLTAFFTRSSAANIPINMDLCEKLGLDRDIYSISIPLGATINMDGAAITITVMTLAAANTVGVNVSFPLALMLSAVAALGACGSSGVAGGSLMLIPMACSIFGISADVALQVVGVGFIISVIQDSVETALNSSSDVAFAATAEYYEWRKQGKELPEFMQRRKKNK